MSTIRRFAPVCLVVVCWTSFQVTFPRRKLQVEDDDEHDYFSRKKRKSNVVWSQGTSRQWKKKDPLVRKEDLRKMHHIDKQDIAFLPKAERHAEEEPSLDSFDWKSHVKFFVLGVQKGGTTSLYKYMGQHPRIPNTEKELRCFNAKYEPSDPLCARHFDKPWFRRISEDYITGDFSPGYIYSQKSVRRIKRAYPEARFIVSLRNPVDRAVSQFKMHERNNKLAPDADFESFCLNELNIIRDVGLLSHWTFPPSFDDSKDYSEEELREMYLLASVNETKFVSTFGSPPMLRAWDRMQQVKGYSAGILRAGLYAPQLHQWLSQFPREQFLVVSIEEMARDTQAVMKRVHAHLGIPHVPINDTAAINKGGHQPAPISDSMRQILAKLFGPFDNMIGPLLEDQGWEVPWTL